MGPVGTVMQPAPQQAARGIDHAEPSSGCASRLRLWQQVVVQGTLPGAAGEMHPLWVASTISHVVHETRRAAILFGGWIPSLLANPRIDRYVRVETAQDEVSGFALAIMRHGETGIGPRNHAPG